MAYPLAMEKHIQEWLESLMQGERKLLFSWAIMEHLIVYDFVDLVLRVK